MSFRNMIAVGMCFTAVILYCGCTNSSTGDKNERRYVAVVDGSTVGLSFRYYGNESTQGSLPKNDFPVVPVLKKGDFLQYYGDLPADEIFSCELVDDTYKKTGDSMSLKAFFNMEHMGSLRNLEITVLAPRESIAAGVYFIHFKIGSKVDAYAAFEIDPTKWGRRQQSNLG